MKIIQHRCGVSVILAPSANAMTYLVWYGMVYINLYSAIVANVSNALGTLVPGKQPSYTCYTCNLVKPRETFCHVAHMNNNIIQYPRVVLLGHVSGTK